MNNNIKKHIKALAMAAAVMGMGMGAVSCNDMLDTTPQGSFTDKQLTENEAPDMLVAAYATLLCHYFGNNESFNGPINNWTIDLRSDDALIGGAGSEQHMLQLEIGNVQNDNAVISAKWVNNTFSVSRCNIAINSIANAGNLNAQEAASMIAEMKTLRAYYNFDMYRLFKKFPYVLENDDPNTVRADAYTRQQIIDMIRQDLRDAYKVLPESQKSVGRFNKYVAAAILARVALYESDWAEAEEYAGYVINSGKYQLYPNFLDISKPEMNNTYESIMAVQFSSANSPDQYNFCNCLNCTVSEGNLYGNGDDFYLGSQDLVNAFRTDKDGLPYLDGSYNSNPVLTADFEGNIDPRLDFTFGRIGMPWRGYMYNEQWCRDLHTYSQFSGKKPYPSPTNPEVKVGIVPWGASSLNYIIIRYADVLLMKAEALIEQNKDLTQARNLINQVRAKAARSVDRNYTPVDINPTVASYKVSQYPDGGSYWTQDYARRAVRFERRLELAMEGHRWFDLVRWGTAVETVNKYYDYEKNFQTYYTPANLSEDEILFPVPLDQKDNSNGLYD